MPKGPLWLQECQPVSWDQTSFWLWEWDVSDTNLFTSYIQTQWSGHIQPQNSLPILSLLHSLWGRRKLFLSRVLTMSAVSGFLEHSVEEHLKSHRGSMLWCMSLMSVLGVEWKRGITLRFTLYLGLAMSCLYQEGIGVLISLQTGQVLSHCPHLQGSVPSQWLPATCLAFKACLLLQALLDCPSFSVSVNLGWVTFHR